MKNRLTDLNDHLFAQLERLSEEDIQAGELEKELSRTQAITAVSKTIISNAALLLRAHKAVSDRDGGQASLPKMLGDGGQ
jgi:hypothetical protein